MQSFNNVLNRFFLLSTKDSIPIDLFWSNYRYVGQIQYGRLTHIG